VKRTAGRQWPGRLLAGLALAAAAAVGIIVVLDAGSSSPSASGNTGKVSGATTVQRRNLVETDTESGTLSYSSPETVYNRLSGTITWLPAVGKEIKPGQPLYKIDGEPVVLMDGATPAYRDLGPYDSDGPDIEQLNRNLIRLGFNAANITLDDVWQPATTEGVDLFQESLGETATGVLSLGQIVFLPGDQLVTTVDGTLGSTGSGSGGTSASATVTPAMPEFASYEVPHASRAQAPNHTRPPACPTTAGNATPNPGPSTSAHHGAGHENSCAPKTSNPKSLSKRELQALLALLALLKAETQERKNEHKASTGGGGGGHSNSGNGGSGSGHGGSGNGGSGNGSSGNGSSGNGGSGNGSGSGSGSGAANATAILQTTSTQLVVTVDLAATVQREAVVGDRVTVEMQDGSTVDGKITAVSPVAQSSSDNGNGGGNGGIGNGNGAGNGNGGNGSGNGSSSTIPVTVTLSGHNAGAGLDQAAVSVNFVEQRASNVLSVPVTALLATGGGNYAVQAAAPPHQLIPVTTGLFAAGYVQISGSGVYPGLQVTDSQG
jgi:Putative peptidoglycan binding domain